MNKKALATFLAAVSCIAAPVTALAAEESTQEISAVLSMEPTYTVTIPATVNMGNDGTSVDVTAADVEIFRKARRFPLPLQEPTITEISWFWKRTGSL